MRLALPNFRAVLKLLPLLFLASFFALVACVEPVEPEFRFRDGFLIVDGKLSTVAGSSQLTLTQATKDGNQFRLNRTTAARVISIDDQGQSVEWELQNSFGQNNSQVFYAPPLDYQPTVGNSYRIVVTDENGSVYESVPELLRSPVEIEVFEQQFEQESFFSDELNRFVPAFQLQTTFTDPAETQDYYRFTYRGWDRVDSCLRCRFSRINTVTGECDPNFSVPGVSFFDYPCRQECWRELRYAESTLLSDEFVNGNSLVKFPSGRINYDWYSGILVIQDLERISSTAYDFYTVLQNQSLNSGGLNTTLPASLVGNVNTVSGEGAVLGYFTVVGGDQQRIYFDRDAFGGVPLPFGGTLNFDIPPPPGGQYFHPCEGPGRSSIRPQGWPQ